MAEWPEIWTAVRAFAAEGHSRPAIDKVGAELFSARLWASLEPAKGEQPIGATERIRIVSVGTAP